jgi:hypothetical protein
MRRVRWLSVSLLAILLFGLCLISQVRDTMDLYEAVHESLVDVTVHGSGIEHVEGVIRRRPGTRPIRILISPGTLFGADSGSVQNMVVTDGSQVDLAASRSGSFRASVACSDLHLNVPGENDSFTVDKLPDRKMEVLKVFPVANRIGVSHEVKQAAVWMVTDDANYRDLGILVGGFPGMPPQRVINAGEAASAMMLLEKAGLDVSSRSIWRERLPICEAAVGNDFTSSAWCGKVIISSTDSDWKVSHLNDKNQAVRKLLKDSILRAHGDENRAALLNALEAPSTDVETARTLVQALGNYAGDDIGAAAIPLLSSNSPDLKIAAIGLLIKLHDSRTPEAVRPLTDSSEELPVRLAAIHALGLLGSSDDLETLESVSAGRQPGIRLAAQQAIQQIKKSPGGRQ